MAAGAFPKNTQMLSLAQSMTRVAAIHFEPGQRTYSLNENCIGTEVPFDNPRLSRSNQLPIVIYHAGHLLQIWATELRNDPIRVLLVDYNLLARRRQIIGHVTIGHVPGDVRISDFRHSIAMGIIPTTMRMNTVYILGIRFRDQDRIPASVVTYDFHEGSEYVEQMEINYNDPEHTYIRCSAAISARAILRQNTEQEINPRRYLSENEAPTLVRNLSSDAVQPRNVLLEPTYFTPRSRMIDILGSRQNLSQTVPAIQNEPSVVHEASHGQTPNAASTPSTGAIRRTPRVKISEKKPKVDETIDNVQTPRTIVRTNDNTSTENAMHSGKTHDDIVNEMKHCKICDLSVGSTEDKMEMHIRNYHESRDENQISVIDAPRAIENTQHTPIDPRYPYWTEPEVDTPITREERLKRQKLRYYRSNLFVNESAPDKEKKLGKAWSIEKLSDERLPDEIEMDKLSDCGESIISELPATVPNRPNVQNEDIEDYASVTDGDLQTFDIEKEDKADSE